VQPKQVETPLFEAASHGRYNCHRCQDLGIWIAPQGDVQICPVIRTGGRHDDPSPAAQLVHRAVLSLRERNHIVNSQSFNLARVLTYYTSARPCPREDLIDMFFRYLPMSEKFTLRKFHEAIETLRRYWLLPVGSRKSEPCGYWIITDEADFKEWFERSKAAPITQLTTIYKVAKLNFPIFAEQMELEFWNDVDGGSDAAA
jgi:hypothetical protein